ncbi:MAG: M1 family peptidase, partial [Pseudomonadota bacterium]|nr:M1 family peptidase [Pseudomonadota bacterium]
MPSVARKWVRLSVVTLSLLAVPLMTSAQTPAPASTANLPSATVMAPAGASSTPPAAIPLTAPDAANFQVPSAPDAWGGPRGNHPATLSDQVVSYTIEALLDPVKHTVEGKQTMTWRNRSRQPVNKIYLHMYLNAFEGPGSTFFTERRLFSGSGHSRGNASLKKGEWGYIELNKVQQGGQPVTWRYVQPDGGPKTDQTVVEMALPQAVPAGGTLSLDIDFHDQLPRVVERTGWFGDFHLVGQWFPKIAVLELPGERGASAPRWNAHEFHFHSEFYADYGNYDVKLTVPKGYTVGAVGQEQGAPVNDGNKVTYHFVQHDVEDFAWVAAPG